MQNANRMKPINNTKSSDIQYDNNKSNNLQFINLLPANKPQSSLKKTNKNILEKYSFQDNESSKSRTDISMDQDINPFPKQNDIDWLQLSVKQITLFSRELIVIFLYFIRQTFYLQIQYTITYNQSPYQHSPIIEKNQKTQSKTNKDQIPYKITENQNQIQDYQDVKYVKSKLVHGSILQNQGKHLVLSLKAKNVSIAYKQNSGDEALKSPQLTNLQFSLIRVYQTSKQGKILSKQIIQNPIVNKEYSIDFWEQKTQSVQKQKPIGTMLFEMFSAITEEPLAKKIYEQQSDNFDDQSEISEQISQNKISARGAYENYTLGVPRRQQNENSRNVFDNSQSQQQNHSQYEPGSYRSSMPNNNQQSSKTQRFKYQSELSSTYENAIVKFHDMSRIDDDNPSKSKNYDEERAVNTQFDSINDNTNSRSKDTKKVNNTSNNNTNLSGTKVKPIVKTQNDYTYVENDPQSRYEGNTTNQREHYLSTLEYSKYVNEQIVLNGSPEVSPITPTTPTNNYKKTTQNKAKQVQKLKTPKFQHNQPYSQQKLNQSTEQVDKNKISSQNFQRIEIDGEGSSQDNSQWLLQNLPDMDSSNIRYKFDDNDISNIQEAKNMQQLISQIQKIQKQWYQKRVLNKQLKQKVNNEINQNKKEMLITKKTRKNRLQDGSNCIDLELRKFKIKLDETTFYNKLIDNLKNKHNANQILDNFRKSGIEKIQNTIKDHMNSQESKDYVVYLIAHQVDEEQMSSPSSQISQKIEIKIPKQQIQDLIEAEKLESSTNLESFLQNADIKQKPSTEKIRKKIIKDFQKQLYSKVMKIKIIDQKQDTNQIPKDENIKDKIPQKTKTKIIQITLQEQFSLLSEQRDVLQNQKGSHKKTQKNKDIMNFNDNRISLIGMYPLPIMKSQKKGQQAQFYQKISNEPLAITMYNMKTGNQEGKLCFQLKKGKIDKEIQTFESLDDLSANDLTENLSPSQMKNESNILTKIQDNNKSTNATKNRNSQQNTKIQEKIIKQKQLKINLNIHSEIPQKQNNSTKKNPNVVQKFNVKQLPVNYQQQNQQKLKSISKKPGLEKIINEPQIKQTFGKNNQVQIHINQPQLLNDSNRQKSNEKSQKIDLSHAGKIVKNIGQDFTPKSQKKSNIYNQQGQINKLNLESINNKNIIPQKFNEIQVKLPQSQKYFPAINLSQQQRQLHNPTQISKPINKSSKNSNRMKTEEKSKTNTYSRMKNLQDDKESSCSSYRLMKQQLQETAGLLENLKLKAQDFINKIEREKKPQSKKSRLGDSSSVKQKKSQQTSQLNGNEMGNQQLSETQRRGRNLQIRTSVISDIVLQKRNKSKSNCNMLDEVEETRKVTPINTKQLKERMKKHFYLKQGGDYQFQSPFYDQNHKSSDLRQKKYTPIRDKSLLEQNQKQRSVEFYSMKIKPLSVNNQKLKKSSLSVTHFVKIYSDLNQLQFQQHEFIQKCYKSSQSSDDNLYVQFANNNLKASQIVLTGKQSTRITIELYSSLQDHSNLSMKKNYLQSNNQDQYMINLITSSPKQHTSSQFIGALSVTFLQLMAQDSYTLNHEQISFDKQSSVINYSNFLYNGQKISGKININFTVNPLPISENETQKRKDTYKQPHIFLNNSLSKQIFTSLECNDSEVHVNSKKHSKNLSKTSTPKNTNQFKFKNTLVDRYNQNLSIFDRNNEDEIRKLRSESGMTKKVSPKRKKMKPNKIQQTEKYSEQSRLVDPLQILKRRLPKPLKQEQKVKTHSNSHHVRVNRPFQTPMNKRVSNNFDSLNSSASLHLKRQKTQHQIHKKNSSGFSSDQVQIKPGRFLQTPQSQQYQLISPKKDRSSQIRGKKNTKDLKNYNIQSRIYPTQETRLSQIKRYDGGNIKFGKSSRFNIVDSPQVAANSQKADFPGPGHYEVKSIFERHSIKEP